MESSSQPAEAWTVARLLVWTQDHLERHGVETPRLCAEILLAHTMRCERIRLYTRYETAPGEDVLGAFRESVRQAAAGCPVAYLTGTKEFLSLPFEVTPDVLIPRPETEVLVERTIDLVRRAGGTLRSVLDLGTGSGCIAVSLAKHLPDAALFASDISETALAVARRNAERHGVAQRIELRCGDLFAPWCAGPADESAGRNAPRTFDVIVCNPPYVGEADADTLPVTVRDFEPRTALFAGRDGLDVLRRIAREAPGWLNAGGYLVLEVAYNQAAAVRALFDARVWRDVRTHRDGLNHERVVQACCPVAAPMHVA